MSLYMPGIGTKTEYQNLGGYLGDVSFYLNGSNSTWNMKALKINPLVNQNLEFVYGQSNFIYSEIIIQLDCSMKCGSQ